MMAPTSTGSPTTTRIRAFLLKPQDLTTPTRLALILLSLTGLIITAVRAPAYFTHAIYDDGLGSSFCTLALTIFAISLAITTVQLVLTYFLHQLNGQQQQQQQQRRSEAIRSAIITLDILAGLALVALVVLTGVITMYSGVEAALVAAYVFAVLVMVGHLGFVFWAGVEARRAIRRRKVLRRVRDAGEEEWVGRA
jgi:small-conductance mechanosensitive channel